ncbi:YobI family P-loop NTPase [Fructobacillus tropaeoli]|uniref:YobI family P-loop NTPase n=1 Tax=Fructobacillus tropaeoli TaxID=709323 RepID=UPI001945116F|nr:P-loop NTPase fold protein [Fructobacillus tropaeoli]GIC69407.1 hypothetical protein FT12353_00430 [Fructobacillus tropaeoli]
MESKQKMLHSLAPNENLKNDSHYESYKVHLRNALNNKHIHNLAITGKYGSGKSSIIDTFFYEEGNFLKVSFSTFDGLKETDPKKSKGMIFANIINQIIYQLDPKQIPLTRFKIKRPISNIDKFMSIVEFLLIVFLVLIPNRNVTSWFLPSLILFFLSFSIGAVILWRFFSKIEIRNFKFSIKPVDTEINMESDDLFEKYTDEIKYLFDHSGKSVLIIEDLDRFEDISIFDKLRELNIKLNITKKWTFIYLIKDDLFENKNDRVKFFDQIIPVIPFITTNNSFDKLRELFSGENINPRLLRILSQFIDDYRLLLNIHNEYSIYSNMSNLNKSIEVENHDYINKHNELLALIAYKNIFPDQFDKIQNGKGLLGDIVNDFRNNIKEQKNKVLESIEQLQEKQANVAAKNETESFLLWAIKKGIKWHTKDYPYSKSFINNFGTVEKIIQEELYITDDVENDFDGPYSQYKENADDYIEYLSPTVYYEPEMKKLNRKLASLNTPNLNDYNFPQISNIDGQEDEQELIRALIKNGFITLDYLNIINHYYGDVSTQIFMRKLYTSSSEIDFNLRLGDIPGLVEQLEEKDYEQAQILNFELIIWLYKNQYNTFEKVLKTARNANINFIEELINLDSSYYDTITQIFPTIEFNLRVLAPIQTYDIALNNRYSLSQQNIQLIIDRLKPNISPEKFIHLINAADVFHEFKVNLIKNIVVNPRISKISLVKKEFVDLLLCNDGFEPTASNMNYYIEHNSFSEELNDFINRNEIIFDEPLTSSTLKSTLVENSLSEERLRRMWEQYSGDKLKAPDISNATNYLILVLIEFHYVEIDKELLILLNRREVEVDSTFFSPEVMELLIKDAIQLSNPLLTLSLHEENQLTDKIFAMNIGTLSMNEVKKYIQRRNLSQGKFIKIMEKTRGHEKIKFNDDDDKINIAILEWMKDNRIIKEFQITNNKLQPLFEKSPLKKDN